MKEVDLLIQALALSPDNKLLRSHIAKLLLESERYEEAFEQYEMLLEEEVHRYEALAKLMDICLELEWYERAQELVETEPQWPYGLLVLSKCCYTKEEYENALEYYENAIDLDAALTDDVYQQELLTFTEKQKVKLKVVELDARRDQYDDVFVRPTISFSDIGGMERVKENIRLNIIFPMQNPELFQAYGKSGGGGILLYGPPGCGKTFISRATAGECRANFTNMSITDILDMYIGESEKNLHELFEKARLRTPSIVFIDEIDAIGGSRHQMQNSTSRILTNQLLIEMDSTQNNNRNLLVIGATNTPWYVDPALRRPGRFDRILFIPPPDLEARIDILQLHMKGKPLEAIDYKTIAQQTHRYSGADLKGICDIASESAIRRAMTSGKIMPITTEDLLDALRVVKPSTIEWLNTAKNYATYSNQSGLYDDILEYLQNSY